MPRTACTPPKRLCRPLILTFAMARSLLRLASSL
jgi:hypothetical protein